MITFLLFYFVLFCLSILISKSLNKVFGISSLGFTSVSFIGAILSLLFLLDYIEFLNSTISFIVYLLVLILALGLQLNPRSRLNLDDLKIIGYYISVLGLGVLFISLPLIFIFPDSTIITGHFISNDSVIHAIISRGFEYTRDIGLPDLYNEGYPRGVHSFIYSLFTIFNVDAYKLILPTIISFSALTPLVTLDLRKKFNIDRFNIILISLLSVTPFLTLVTTYLLFLPQIVAIPFVIGLILHLPRSDSSLWKLIVWFVAALAVFNIYGVFSLTLVAFVYLGIIIFRSIKERTFIKLDKNKIIRWTFIIIVFLILSIPAIFINTRNLVRQSGKEVGSDYLTSIGNLPGGFLSPFHITGYWGKSLEYRDNISGEQSNLQYLLLAILLFQLFFIFNRKNDGKLVLKLFLLFIPVLASAFIIKNQYLQFKYLTFLIPLFSVSFGIAFYSYFKHSNKMRVLTFTFFLIYIGANFFFYSKSFKYIPVVQEHQFNEFSYLYNNYLNDKGLIILSREDWFQYFVKDKNVYLPLTQYLVKPYADQEVKYVIWDKGYDKDNQGYVNQKINIKSAIESLSIECIEEKFGRYVVYTLECD